MDYGNSGGFQIPWLLIQFPTDFGGADTTNPETIIKPKWFESHNGRYSGDWKPWCDANGDQYDGHTHSEKECVKVGAIEIDNVKFTQAKVNKNGAWRLYRSTKDQIEIAPSAQWDRFK